MRNLKSKTQIAREYQQFLREMRAQLRFDRKRVLEQRAKARRQYFLRNVMRVRSHGYT